jgi:hypothetical protein
VRARRSGTLESESLAAAPGPALAAGEAALMGDARLVLPALGPCMMTAEHNFASRPLSFAGDSFESGEKQSPKSKGSKLSPWCTWYVLCAAAGCCHFARVLPALPSSGVLSAFCICAEVLVDDSSAASPDSGSDAAVEVSAKGEELFLRAALPPASAPALLKFPCRKTCVRASPGRVIIGESSAVELVPLSAPKYAKTLLCGRGAAHCPDSLPSETGRVTIAGGIATGGAAGWGTWTRTESSDSSSGFMCVFVDASTPGLRPVGNLAGTGLPGLVPPLLLRGEHEREDNSASLENSTAGELHSRAAASASSARA